MEGKNHCLGNKETLEVMEIFGILIVVVVSPMHIFIKIHQILLFKQVQLIVHKLFNYLQTNKINVKKEIIITSLILMPQLLPFDQK